MKCFGPLSVFMKFSMRPILLAILASLLCASLAAASPNFYTNRGRTAYDADPALDEDEDDVGDDNYRRGRGYRGDLEADQFRLSEQQAAELTDDVNDDDGLVELRAALMALPRSRRKSAVKGVNRYLQRCKTDGILFMNVCRRSRPGPVCRKLARKSVRSCRRKAKARLG